MKREETRAFWLGLLLALLLTRAVRALFSTLWYESLVTLRLNGTAFWMLALLVAGLAPLLPRRATWAGVAVAALATAALPLARFSEGYIPLAALASGACLLALVRTGSLGGAVVGIALEGALLVLGRSVDPLPALTGPILLGAGAIALAWRPFDAREPARHGAVIGAAAGALLIAELAFFANPYSAARWTDSPAWAIAIAGGIGLVLGATRLRHVGWPVWLAAALGLFDVVFVRSPLVVLSFGAVQLAMGSAASRFGPHLPSARGALGFAIVFAAAAFGVLFFHDPFGPGSEWGVVAPLLALLALAPALSQARPKRARISVGAIPLAALFALGAIAAGMPTTIAEPDSDGELTLITWNVHQAFGNRGALDPAIYREVLASEDADIIVLQESDTPRLASGGVDIVQYLAHELGMHAAFGPSSAAILSRHPFTDAPRPAVDGWTYEAAVDIDGREVWVHGVHIARGRFPEQRIQQVTDLVEDPHGPYHLVAGDLNLCATGCFRGAQLAPGAMDENYVRLTSRYQDAWVAAGHGINDPAGFTHGSGPSRRIDHVLVEGVEVLEARVIVNERSRLASDHFPLLVRFRLNESA